MSNATKHLNHSSECRESTLISPLDPGALPVDTTPHSPPSRLFNLLGLSSLICEINGVGEHRRGLEGRLGALESFPAALLWFSEAIIKQGEAESFNQRMVGRTGRLHREGDMLLCHFLDEKTEALRVGSGQTVSQWLSWVRNPGLWLPVAAGLPSTALLGGGLEAHRCTCSFI